MCDCVYFSDCFSKFKLQVLLVNSVRGLDPNDLLALWLCVLYSFFSFTDCLCSMGCLCPGLNGNVGIIYHLCSVPFGHLVNAVPPEVLDRITSLVVTHQEYLKHCQSI